MKCRMMALLLLLGTGPGMAQQAASPQVAPPHQAASQIHSSEDAQLQASVRRAIANDASLSEA